MSNPLCASPRCRAYGQHADGCTDGQCRGCLPRQAADGANLCHVCGRRLGEDITGSAKLWHELALRLAGGNAGGEKVASKPGPRVPDMAVVTARGSIITALTSWARLVMDERGVLWPMRRAVRERPEDFIGPMPMVAVRDESVEGIAAFLRRHLDWLAARPTAGEMAGQMAELAHGRPHRMAYPNGARVFEVARCPVTDDDGVQCDGTIKAILRRTDSLLPSELICDMDDAHRWDSTAWVRLGRKLESMKAEACAT